MSRNRVARPLPARVRSVIRQFADRGRSRRAEPVAPERTEQAPAGGSGDTGDTGGQNASARQDQLRAKIFADFFRTLNLDGDADRAMVELARRFIARSEPTRARTPLQVFSRYDPMRPAAEISLALVAYAEGLPDPAWALFTRNDLEKVLRWAPVEYFELAFATDPDTAAESLRRALTGAVAFTADASVWLHIANFGFAAGHADLAAEAVARADAAIAAVTDPARVTRLTARSAALHEWIERAAHAGDPVERQGDAAFALVGYRHPDWAAISTDPDDVTETLANAGHLVRRAGLEFAGEQNLAATLRQLADTVPADRRVTGEARTVSVFEVDRDLSRFARIPDGTWTIVSEWFTHPLSGDRFDLPLDPRMRPIFVSFHITPDQLAKPGAVEYLRAHGPIGCADWDGVFLLHARGIPAFFSGTSTAAVGNVVGADGPAGSTGSGPDGDRPELREHSLAENLLTAVAELRARATAGKPVAATTVRSYLAARAVGADAEFRPDNLGDHRVVDYLDLDDAAFAAQRDGISDKLRAVVDAVLAGRSDDEVYAVWREVCASDVAEVETAFTSITDDPPTNFDVDRACDVIRTASVVVAPTEPAGSGSEINVEFSVDQNYKHQLEIVLDSVVQRTERPVHAYVLCRGFGQPDYDRLARLFPTVAFTWLPTDDVDYGPIPDKIKWATIVTMDRTMLPELLPEVDRIIHFDLDALCLGDLAELFDVDMEGTAIAAVDSPQPVYLGGLDTFRRATRRMRREGQLDVARELIIRTHRQHPNDFEIFNAGIMVLDLAKMRADGVVRRYLGYIQRFGVNGQVIMNIYVGRDRKKVHGDWNRLVRLEIAPPPKVAHWAGPIKPWAGHQYAPGREWWQEQEEHFAARTAALSG